MSRNRIHKMTSGPSTKGQVKFYPLSGDSNPTKGVVLQGPSSVGASDLTLTLPSADLADGVYKSDGSGNQSISKLVDVNVAVGAAIALGKLALLTASRALVSDGSGVISASAVTATELGYVSGVSSAIQTQINGKEPTITQLPISKGGTNSVTALNNNRVMKSSGGAIVEAAAITASKALASDANGIPVAGAPTATELDYLAGVTNTNGGVVYGNGTALRTTGAGSSGQVLQSNGAAAPSWVTPSNGFFGSIYWAAISGGNWTANQTSFADFAPVASYTLPSGSALEGNAAAPATKIPAIFFSSMPAGDYLFIARGAFYLADNQQFTFRFSDGTNFTKSVTMYPGNSGGVFWPEFSGRLHYASTQTNVTITIQARTLSGSHNATIWNDTSGTIDGLQIDVYKF